MTVGWFDPESLEFPAKDHARIKTAVLDDSGAVNAEWLDIRTPPQAFHIARALREQARYGLSGLDRPLAVIEVDGALHIDSDGTISGNISRDGRKTPVTGRIDLRSADAPPVGGLEGQFILLGHGGEDGFRIFRLGAEIPAPMKAAGPAP